jgi:enamine deaminase RidA (YjgF/YER057c/UK114 family)
VTVAALRSPRPLDAVPMSTPTLNEAPSYGADFSRGTRVDLPDRTLLYISGTASIDTEGRVVARGDIEGQIERTLVNVEAMLRDAGAGYGQAVSAVTYLKEPRFAAAFRRIASRHGMPESLPNALCVADICRPEWLCEVEVTAVLPHPPKSSRHE